MKKKLITGLFLSALTGVASAADPGFFFPGGARQDSIIHAPGTTLNGKTVTQWGAQIDANATAAANAQTSADTASSAATTNAAAVKTAQDTANTAVTNAATAQSSADAAQTTANAAIPLTQKGAASGVAALDENADVTNDVNSNIVLGSNTVNSGYMPVSPTWAFNGWLNSAGHMAGPRITTDTPHLDMNSQLADHVLSVGGHQLYDSVFSKFYALPYGVGDKGGCVFSVNMTGAPGTAATCGAGGWDAVTEYELAANNAPWYMAGSTITDEYGATHSVTFTLNGSIVRPMLPSGYKQQMHVGMHVLTNIVAGPTIYSGNSIDGVQSHENQDQQFYGNTLNTWEDGEDSTGTYTKFDMSGQWQPISGNPVDTGHIPSVGTSNTSEKTNSSGEVTNSSDASRVDALDQAQYSEFTQPILVFGTYVKHFTRNTTCEVTVESGTDGSASARYGASRKCDEELDNWYSGPDYGATMHGLTIGSRFDNKVSQDSYGLSVAGEWPAGARVWLGSDGIDFDGDEYVTGARKGSEPVIGNKKSMAQWWQEPSANVGYLESVNLWSQIDSISVADNPTTGAASANGQDISYWFGPRQSASKYNVDGSFESAISFNPNWSKNGIALCGASASGYFGLSDEGKYCLTVDYQGNTNISGNFSVSGDTTIDGNASVGAGKAITFHPSSGDYSPYEYASSQSVVSFANNAGPYVGISALGNDSFGTTSVSGTLTVSGYTSSGSYIGTLATPSSSTADCTAGQFQDDANYHYVCVATNTWKRVALSSF